VKFTPVNFGQKHFEKTKKNLAFGIIAASSVALTFLSQIRSKIWQLILDHLQSAKWRIPLNVNEVNFQKFVAQKLHWLSFAQIVSLILHENALEKNCR
jgi:hypothetical protein